MPYPPVVQIPVVDKQLVVIPNQTPAAGGAFDYNFKIPDAPPSWLNKAIDDFGESYLTADLGADSGPVGDLTQNRLVHENFGIPYFHKPDTNRLYVGFTVTIPVGK